jgi:hypothetical protein
MTTGLHVASRRSVVGGLREVRGKPWVVEEEGGSRLPGTCRWNAGA